MGLFLSNLMFCPIDTMFWHDQLMKQSLHTNLIATCACHKLRTSAENWTCFNFNFHLIRSEKEKSHSLNLLKWFIFFIIIVISIKGKKKEKTHTYKHINTIIYNYYRNLRILWYSQRLACILFHQLFFSQTYFDYRFFSNIQKVIVVLFTMHGRQCVNQSDGLSYNTYTHSRHKMKQPDEDEGNCDWFRKVLFCCCWSWCFFFLHIWFKRV
jgi:hypothetical protein